MEGIAAANVVTNGTDEIPAKHHKSSGIYCVHYYAFLDIYLFYFIS